MNIVIWIAQVLLALLFLMSGAMKVSQPINKEVTSPMFAWIQAVPPALVRTIGACEVLGAIGLILPAVTNILPWLTIGAASGLALLMILAIIFHLSRREYAPLPFNFALLVLALFIVYGRWMLVPFA